MPMSILEPPRMPLGMAAITKSTNSQCCNCCKDYGPTIISFKTDKNFVVNGQDISGMGFVDNTKGSADIKTCTVMLRKCRVMVSSKGRTKYEVDQAWAIHGINNEIPAYSKKDFQFTGKIPADIVQSTAIGRITGIYYLLHFGTEYGCCANTADATIHLIVHSRTPIVLQKPHIERPQVWNPQVFPPFVFEKMKPFVLNPMAQIPYHNQAGQVVAQQPTLMTEPSDYYQQANLTQADLNPNQNYGMYNGQQQYNGEMQQYNGMQQQQQQYNGEMQPYNEMQQQQQQQQQYNGNYVPDINQFINYVPVYYPQSINTAYLNNQQHAGG